MLKLEYPVPKPMEMSDITFLMDTEHDDMEMEVEPEVDMDVGESIPSSSVSSFAGVGTSSKRLAVKNTIQTNFGDDYVFQIASRYSFIMSNSCTPFFWFPEDEIIVKGCD